MYRAEDKSKMIAEIAFDPFDSPFQLREEPATATSESRTPKRSPLLPTDFKTRMRESEKELLQAALEKGRFNQRVAADLLSLTYDQLRGKLRKHKLDRR